MARRRADGEPGLIERVRWRNVGRLAVALVAVLVVLVGPRGCGRQEAPLPPEVRVAPSAPAPPVSTPELADGSKQLAERPHHRRHRKHRRARKHHAPKAVAPPAAPVAPAPAPLPAPASPAPR